VSVAAGVALACGSPAAPDQNPGGNPPPPPPVLDPLREVVADRNIRIGVGTAVGALFNTTDAVGVQYNTVLRREFNALTPENDLKFGPLRPARASFNYTRADAMLQFAQANGMRVRGHVLVWHNQLASWLTGATWTADEARQLLDEHITNVVTHYRGQLAAWDVVNESFTDGGTPTLRSGFWANNIGRGYIEQAFRTARAADPDVPLYYNDYNIEGLNAKADSVYGLLSDFRARGVPVDGIGMQMHLVAGQLPSLTEMRQNFERFAALGLKIQITELDIRVALPPTPQSLQTQAENYRDVFDLCLQVPACDMVVMWGFTDRSSWIPSVFPGQGDALLFDNNFQPKPAYNSVHTLLSSR
jgi:endo-1,4-beta-xylanase